MARWQPTEEVVDSSNFQEMVARPAFDVELANKTLRIKKDEQTSETPEVAVPETGGGPEEELPGQETVDGAFQDILWPPRGTGESRDRVSRSLPGLGLLE